jgi:hypothetical protein
MGLNVCLRFLIEIGPVAWRENCDRLFVYLFYNCFAACVCSLSDALLSIEDFWHNTEVDVSWSDHAWQSSDEDGDFRWRLSTFEEMGAAYNAWHFKDYAIGFPRRRPNLRGEF